MVKTIVNLQQNIDEIVRITTDTDIINRYHTDKKIQTLYKRSPCYLSSQLVVVFQKRPPCRRSTIATTNQLEKILPSPG